jgi:hypothetical protein
MLTIGHAVTDDLPNGQPLPPVDDYQWAVVRRSAGFTFWRRIFLTTETQTRKLET